MKKFVLLFSLFLSVMIVSGQEMPKDSIGKKEIKKSKKEEKVAKFQKQYEANYQMLFNRAFVINTHYIERVGIKYSVDPFLNFILVDSTNAIIQIGSLTSIGYNGVGGETAKGKIATYKLTKNDKKKSCFLMMQVLTPIYTFDVSIDVRASGAVSAWISGMSFGALVFEGYILPINEAKVKMGGTFN